MKDIKKTFSINSLLGEQSSLKGIFTIDGPLRIDGNFKGKINSSGRVIIGKNGVAECIIIAKIVIIGGTVKGDIYADDKVIVLKTGQIIGNIYALNVNMEDGVIFNGKCNIIDKNNIKELLDSKRKEQYLFN